MIGHDQSKNSQSTSITNRYDVTPTLIGGSGELEAYVMGSGSAFGTGSAPVVNLDIDNATHAYKSAAGGEKDVNIHLNMMDGGAIQGGLGLASQALNLGFGHLAESLVQQSKQSQTLTESVTGALERNTQTAASDMQNQLKVIVGGLLVMGGLIVFWMKG